MSDQPPEPTPPPEELYQLPGTEPRVGADYLAEPAVDRARRGAMPTLAASRRRMVTASLMAVRAPIARAESSHASRNFMPSLDRFRRPCPRSQD
jgi:hypothetical protein